MDAAARRGTLPHRSVAAQPYAAFARIPGVHLSSGAQGGLPRNPHPERRAAILSPARDADGFVARLVDATARSARSLEAGARPDRESALGPAGLADRSR